jgi:lysozyme
MIANNKGKSRMDKFRNILIQNKKWIIILSASLALYGGFKAVQKLTEKQKKEISVDDLKIKPAETYEEFLNQCRPITPYLICYLANPEGFESETYQDGRGVWTIGYGSTRMPNGPVGPNTQDITIDQAYEIARWHIENYETYFIMYCYCCAFDRSMNSHEFLGLASFIYNGGPGMFEPNIDTKNGKPGKIDRARNDRWAELRSLYRKQGTISSKQIKELFKKYPVVSQGSVFKAWLDGKSGEEIGQAMTNYLRSGGGRAEGLVWRRWLEACLTSGDINPIDIMNAPIGGIYEFRQYLKSKNMDMISKDNIINYPAADTLIVWLKAPQYWDKKNKKLYTPKNIKLTKSVMPKEIVALCEYGYCSVSDKPSAKFYNNDSLDRFKSKESAENLIELGTKYLYDNNYEKAEEVYLTVIKKDQKNATAYSDLSYLYLKWGKYEEGVAIVNVLDSHITESMNSNALAGAYYNAGLCYKKMGGAKYLEKAKKQLPKVKVYQKEIDSINVKLQELKNAEKSKDAAKKKSKYESAKAKTSVKQLSQKHNNTKNQKTR